MNYRTYKGKSLVLDLEDYTVLDIETTGLDSFTSKIIEISAIKVRGKKEVDTFSVLINPHRPLSYFIKNLTGITDEMLEEGLEIEDALIMFKEFLAGDIIVGHNVNFDVNFLYDNYEKYLDIYLTNDFVDTLKIARRVLNLSHNRLDDFTDYFGITARDKHRALNDCSLTNKVYINLCKELGSEVNV